MDAIELSQPESIETGDIGFDYDGQTLCSSSVIWAFYFEFLVPDGSNWNNGWRGWVGFNFAKCCNLG